MKKQRHKHTYKLKIKKNEKENDELDFLKFRQQPFLQTSGVPACALPYAVWSIVNIDGISSIKIDKLSQG